MHRPEARGGRRAPANVWGSAATGAALALLVPLLPAVAPQVLSGFAASFSAKLADTCGSEIGKRWGRTTLLITTLTPWQIVLQKFRGELTMLGGRRDSAGGGASRGGDDDYSSGFSTGGANKPSGPKESYDLNDDIPF